MKQPDFVDTGEERFLNRIADVCCLVILEQGSHADDFQNRHHRSPYPNSTSDLVERVCVMIKCRNRNRNRFSSYYSSDCLISSYLKSQDCIDYSRQVEQLLHTLPYSQYPIHYGILVFLEREQEEQIRYQRTFHPN